MSRRRGVGTHHRNRVVDGRVQFKNRWDETPTYYNIENDVPAIVREKPGPGFKHLLRKSDIETFVRILPDWDELAKGLNAIVLAQGEDNTDGWHNDGVVAVCAWERSLWQELEDNEFVAAHAPIWQRLGVDWGRQRDGRETYVEVRWTESQARAYQLLHILLHELGHHHDQMTTKSQRDAARGEPFAEAYANNYADIIWDRYFEVFGLD